MRPSGSVLHTTRIPGGPVSMGPMQAMSHVLAVREQCESEIRMLSLLARQGLSAETRRAAMRLSARLDFACQQLTHLRGSALRGLAESEACSEVARAFGDMDKALTAILAQREPGGSAAQRGARRG